MSHSAIDFTPRGLPEASSRHQAACSSPARSGGPSSPPCSDIGQGQVLPFRDPAPAVRVPASAFHGWQFGKLLGLAMPYARQILVDRPVHGLGTRKQQSVGPLPRQNSVDRSPRLGVQRDEHLVALLVRCRGPQDRAVRGRHGPWPSEASSSPSKKASRVTLCSAAPCSRGSEHSIREARRLMEVRSIRQLL